MSDLFYDIHIFCCTNLRDDGRESCAEKGAVGLRDYMKDQVKKLKSSKIRVNSAGCLNRCAEGPTMVIYPEGIWYSYHNKQDIDEIIEQHIKNGRKVDRLLME